MRRSSAFFSMMTLIDDKSVINNFASDFKEKNKFVKSLSSLLIFYCTTNDSCYLLKVWQVVAEKWSSATRVPRYKKDTIAVQRAWKVAQRHARRWNCVVKLLLSFTRIAKGDSITWTTTYRQAVQRCSHSQHSKENVSLCHPGCLTVHRCYYLRDGNRHACGISRRGDITRRAHEEILHD